MKTIWLTSAEHTKRSLSSSLPLSLSQDLGTAGWKQAPPLSGSETSDHTYLS